MREINSFLYFLENGQKLLRANGKLGFIIPDTMLSKIQYYNFRKYLFNTITVEEIIETSSVFEHAKGTPNIIIIFKNIKPKYDDKIVRKIVDFRKKLNETLNDIHFGNFFEVGLLNYKVWGDSYLYSFGKYINE